jgi:vacuolar-type H+-ATPase subunit E/Vma4
MALRQTDEDGNVPPVPSKAEQEAKHSASVERRKKLAEQLQAMMSGPFLEEEHEVIRNVLSNFVIS